MRSISLPYRGATNNSAFIRQPGDAAPLARLRNARVRAGPDGRQQIGTRPPIERLTTRALGTGEVQGMVKVTRRAGVTGYQMGECEHMGDVQNGGTGLLAGNWAFIDGAPSLAAFVDLDVSGDGGAATTPVSGLSTAPDELHIAAMLVYTSAGYSRTRIRLVERDLDLAWQVTISNASQDRRGAFVLVTDEYVLVGINTQADPSASNVQLLVYDRADGTLLETNTMRGWAGRIIGAGRYVVDDVEYVRVAFDGSTYGAPGSPGLHIDDGNPASMFQSGFMEFQLRPRADVGGGVLPLIEINFATPLELGDVGFDERGHGYWRLSEWTTQRPYGRWITSISVAPDGTTFLTTTSHGYGHTFAYTPDGQALPAINVFAVSRAGELIYESNTDPVVEVGMGGFYNDIPISGADLASLLAGCVAPDGTFFCGGRNGQGGYSTFGLDPNGMVIWRTKLMSASTVVRCAVLDPESGIPIFGGDRHTSWPGSSGADAHLWMLSPNDGTVVWGWDIGKVTPVRAVAVGVGGEFTYGCDRV